MKLPHHRAAYHLAALALTTFACDAPPAADPAADALSDAAPDATEPAAPTALMPADAVIVARNLSAADLIEYDRSQLRGVILEEGSLTAHVTIVARAFDIPVIGRVEGAMSLIEPDDPLALDGDHGAIFVRPTEDVLQAFQQTVQRRAERRRVYEAQRHLPAVTLDGIRVSLFVDPEPTAIEWAHSVGAHRVELYTEPFARAFERGPKTAAESFEKYVAAAERAHRLGLGVNAGHDLDLRNLTLFRNLPHLDEVSIGHALISRALFVGLRRTVRDYLRTLAAEPK